MPGNEYRRECTETQPEPVRDRSDPEIWDRGPLPTASLPKSGTDQTASYALKTVQGPPTSTDKVRTVVDSR